jgi:hypothetical protein
MALSLESGGGEAALLFQAAERLDSLESTLRNALQQALFLRATLADVDALLAGEQIDPVRFIADPVAEAAAKAAAGVRVANRFGVGK